MAGLIQSRNPVAMGVVKGFRARLGEKFWSRTYGPKIDALLQQGASKAPQQGAAEQQQQGAVETNSGGNSGQQQPENGSTMLTGAEGTTLGGGRMKKKTLLGG